MSAPPLRRAGRAGIGQRRDATNSAASAWQTVDTPGQQGDQALRDPGQGIITCRVGRGVATCQPAWAQQMHRALPGAGRWPTVRVGWGSVSGQRHGRGVHRPAKARQGPQGDAGRKAFKGPLGRANRNTTSDTAAGVTGDGQHSARPAGHSEPGVTPGRKARKDIQAAKSKTGAERQPNDTGPEEARARQHGARPQNVQNLG